MIDCDMDNQTGIQTALAQASGLLDERRDEEASRLYIRICQEHPESTEAWSGLAVACLRLRRYPECLQAIARTLSLDSRQLQPYLIAAVAASQMGRYAEVIQAADAALAIAPEHLQALNSKASALLNQQQYAQVLPLTEQILRIDPSNTNAHLNQGVALYGLGQSLAALEAFDRLLSLVPDHVNALVNRSSVLVTLDRAEEALQATDAALRVRPDAAVALLNRIAALLSLRRPCEALTTADRLLQLHPHHIKGLINKAVALLALRDYRSALTTVFTALTFDSFNPDALELKLQALLGLRRFAEVITEGPRIISKYPDRTVLKLALAKALMGLGRIAEAESYVNAVLVSSPHQPEAISLKTEILFSGGEWDAGRTLIDQALAENPGQAQLWVAKSAILLATECYSEALAAAEQALVLEPEQLQAAINRIAALNGLHRFSEALSAIQELLECEASDWQIYANQGGALAGLERFEEAGQAFETARALDRKALQLFRLRHEIYGVIPDAAIPDVDPRAEYLAFKLGRLERCDWRDYEMVLSRTKALVEQCLAERWPAPLPPFKSLVLPLPLRLTAAIAGSHGEFLASSTVATRQRLAFTGPALTTSRLKIGYVSADFRNHPTAHLMRGLFRRHDRKRFEIYVYALCKDDNSDYYRQIKADAEQFVDLTDMTNADAASHIHRDGIHVLIDLMGYTAYARSEIFALQPAPVQVSYLGYPGTTGASFISYIIADPIVLPEDIQSYFTEKPVYLPECYQINDREQVIATTGIGRKDEGLPEAGIVFCCFNKSSKLDPLMFAVWTRILQQVPNSVLWLLASKPEVITNLRREAEDRGIAGERLIFAERLPKDRHLERHRLADLFLDTQFYNAHTTASDALWAGLPVLTCIGQTFQARVTASLLQAIGMPELITHSLEEYEALAVRLATQPIELESLREKLAYNRLRTPLFDTKRFTQHLERAYEVMWERYTQGLPPVSLWVTPLPNST